MEHFTPSTPVNRDGTPGIVTQQPYNEQLKQLPRMEPHDVSRVIDEFVAYQPRRIVRFTQADKRSVFVIEKRIFLLDLIGFDKADKQAVQRCT